MKDKKNKSQSAKHLADKITGGNYPALIITSIIFLIYIKTIQYKFSPLDDLSLIVNRMEWLSNPANIKEVFTKGVFEDKNTAGSYYRPLLTLSFMIDAVIGLGNPAFFHLSNMIYHIIACILCFYLFLLVLKDRRISMLFSLIFAVHPVIVQAVAWVPGRNDTLLAIFVFSSLIYYLKYLESGTNKFLILHILFFILVLLTKESAVVLPIITIFLYFLTKKEKKLSGLLILGAQWLVVIICWFIIKNLVVQTQFNLEVIDPKKIVINAFQAFIVYIGKGIIPFPQSILPNTKDDVIIPAIILITLLVFLSLKYGFEDRNKAIFGLVWMVIFLSIPMVVASIDASNPHYEHRMYLPLVGLLLFISQLKVKHSRNYILLCTIILLFSIKSFVRAGVYKNKFSFSNTAVHEAPSLPMSFNLRGQEYKSAKQYELAAADFNKALTINPKYVGAIFNLGVTLNEMGSHEQAISEINKGLLIDSLNAGAIYARGNSYFGLKKFDKAIADYTKSIKLYPSYDQAYNNRGNVFAQQNLYDNALADYTEAIKLNKKNASAFCNRANVYSSLGKYDLAMKDIDMALTLKPEDKDFQQNKLAIQKENAEKSNKDESSELSFLEKQILPKALELFKNGDYNSSAELFLKLYNEEKGNPNQRKALSHYNNYGQCLYRLKRLPEAENVFSRIILMDPKYEKAYLNLANINRAKGNLKTAKIMYQKVIELNPNNSVAQRGLASIK